MVLVVVDVLQEHAPDVAVAGERQQRPSSGQRHAGDGGRVQQDDGDSDEQHGDEPQRSGFGPVQHRGRAQPGKSRSRSKAQ